MPAFTTTVIGLAALAGSLVLSAPIAPRAAPKHWADDYLEDYDVYHVRYIAIDCQDKHNTTFFDDCCHPLLATQSLAADRAAYCVPNATEVASATAYIASTSLYGVPTASSTPTGSFTADAQVETDYAVASSSTTSSAVATSSASPQAAFAEAKSSSTTTYVAPTTTSTYVYVAPTTSTTPVYVAPTTTSTTPAYVAPTTAAASSNTGSGSQTGGFATYFYQGGNAGACGTVHGDYDKVIAIDSAWWPNFGATSQYCGKWITVQNTNNGKTTTAMVADVCPTCTNGNSLDLSVGAFTAIASEGDGMVPITWWWA